MSKSAKIILGIIVFFSAIFIGILIVLGLLDAGPIFGLLGVVVGATISETSKYQSSERDRTQQLRLAALDKRLQTHQEAYTLWRNIIRNLNDKDLIASTVTKCQTWWEENCLYLEPDARQAFVQAYLSVSSVQVAIRSRDALGLKIAYDVLRKAGDIIVQGVALPSIREREYEMVGEHPFLEIEKILKQKR